MCTAACSSTTYEARSRGAARPAAASGQATGVGTDLSAAESSAGADPSAGGPAPSATGAGPAAAGPTAAGGGGTTGSGTPTTAKPGTSGQAPGAGGSGPASSSVTTRPAGPSPSGIAPPQPTSPTSPTGTAAPPIAIGVAYQGRQSGSTLATIGVSGADPGDGRAAAQAVVDYLNGKGGIAGRKIAPVYREFDGTQNWTAQYQAECAHFTQDHLVFAVVSQASLPGWETSAACLAKRQVPYFQSFLQAVDAPLFSQFSPYLYAPGELSGDRWGAVVDQLAAGGYFDPGTKLGLFYIDLPQMRRTLTNTVKPRLAHYGVTVAAEASLSPYYSISDFSQAAAQAQNAVLKFRTQGVDHVLITTSNGIGPLVFLPQAESQGFRPRYAWTSVDLPAVWAPQLPRAQMKGAVTVGWRPTVDVDFAQDPGDNPEQALCLDIVRKAGVKVPSRFAAYLYTSACDGLFFLKATLDGAPAVTPDGLRAATDRLGTSYRSPLTFSTSFGPGRFDGAGAVRRSGFDDGCGCFRYSGAATPTS